MSTGTPLTTKQAFWLEYLQTAAQSGQSLSSYAQAHGLNAKQLYYWSKVLRQRGLHGNKTPSSNLFHKAHIVAQGACRIILPRGVILELDTAPEPAWVAQLLGALS